MPDLRPQLIVLREIRDDAVVVRVDGEVDMVVADDFRSHLDNGLDAARTHRSQTLIVELQAIGFFGSAGLTALLRCQERAVVNGVTIVLASTNHMVIRIIEITKTDGIFPIYPTLDQAAQATREH